MFEFPADDRGVSPVIGSVTLVLISVLLVGAIGSSVVGAPTLSPSADPPVVLSVAASDDGTVEITHEGGRALDLTQVDLRISVDGQPLAEQPPVPFFSTSGFAPGPTGPFNSASDNEWTVGETGAVRIAGTNRPSIDAGSTLTISVLNDGRTVATAETTVSGTAGDGDEG
ncbi:MAG: type IV pilin [Halanaeroarchaeum sp.]